MSKYIDELNYKMNLHGLDKKEQKEFYNIIKPIFNHEEFQKRLDNSKYPHHGNTSLGSHILSDAIETYIIVKRKNKKGKNINLKLAVVIAMCHDLYELPWQNSGRKESRFTNKHGFTHPLEATINACTWFPEYFKNLKESAIIIDGILHHMYPLPVRALDNTDAELNNSKKLEQLDERLVLLIKELSNRKKIGTVSFTRSKYQEGRIVSYADKTVTIKSDKLSLKGYKALLTGKNDELKK